MIPVTKPFLPPIQEYEKYLQGIWSRNWLTNNGPLVNELELGLKDYLQVRHLRFVTNVTIGIQPLCPISHDRVADDFVEMATGVRVTGGCTVGNFSIFNERVS